VQSPTYLRSRIEEMIKLQPVMVFSKSWCPFCKKAKDALSAAGVKAAFLELDNLGPETEAEVQDILRSITGESTVPRVFIGGTCIGGGTDTVRLQESGELSTMADKALEEHGKYLKNDVDWQLKKTEEEWKKEIQDPAVYNVLRRRGTEAPGSHPFSRDFLPKAGHFSCAGCSLPLYSASSKFASSCGWPVFDKCYGSKDIGQHVTGQPDGTGSLEIVCTRCGSHMGHVFYDAVSEANPNGERH